MVSGCHISVTRCSTGSRGDAALEHCGTTVSKRPFEHFNGVCNNLSKCVSGASDLFWLLVKTNWQFDYRKNIFLLSKHLLQELILGFFKNGNQDFASSESELFKVVRKQQKSFLKILFTAMCHYNTLTGSVSCFPRGHEI